MTSRSPKDSLSGQELIGFMRPSNDGAQVARRASSAKVTVVEPSPRKLQAGSEHPLPLPSKERT